MPKVFCLIHLKKLVVMRDFHRQSWSSLLHKLYPLQSDFYRKFEYSNKLSGVILSKNSIGLKGIFAC